MVKIAKTLLGLAAFALGLLVILYGLSFLFIPKNNTKDAGMEEVIANGIQGEPENSIDVVVVGDSESYFSISPLLIWKDTGYTSYVCGSGRQYLSYSKTLLERAFETQSPKLVILETLCIYRQIPAKTVVMDEVSRYLPILRYHDRWKTMTREDFSPTDGNSYTTPYKGYRLSSAASSADASNYMTYTDKAASIPVLNRLLVEQIQELCEEHGAKLLLLSTPSTVNWNYQRHNGIQELADELGLEYIDLNTRTQEVPIDWSKDTFDRGDHLNHTGTVKVSQFLAKYLEGTQMFSDRRGDSKYANWNNLLENYEAEVAKAAPK